MLSYLTTLFGTQVELTSSTSVLAAPVAGVYDGIPIGDLSGRLQLQGHRGAGGVRTENSLYAFAYAMEMGVDILEMDLLFTKDEVPIIWHDHSLTEEKCVGDYVGQFIVNLTLAQVKSMDCNLRPLEHQEQEVYPRTRIPTLVEMLDFITCYGDDHIILNIETKLDPRYPNETFAPSVYVDNIIPIIEAKGFGHRTLIQSFDFRTLFGIGAKYPSYPLVALLDPVTILQDDDGSYPWLGGIQLDSDEYKGDWVLASYATGAKIIGPWYGNGTVGEEGYEAFTTQEIVDRAHELGMEVHPWTVDDEVSISEMLGFGVECVVGNYPDKVVAVGERRGMEVGRRKGVKRKEECFVNLDWRDPIESGSGEAQEL